MNHTTKKLIGSMVILSAGLFASSPAKAAPVPLSSKSSLFASDAMIKNNATLVDYDTWLANQQIFFDAGFLDTDNDPADLSVKLLWHDPLDSKLVTAALNEAAARGIKAVIKSWPYSRQEIDAGTSALWKVIQSNAWTCFNVLSIATLDPLAPGFAIEGDFTDDVREKYTEALVNSQLARLLSAARPLPVNLIPGILGGNSLGRTTDTSSFFAGGLMHMDNYGICTNFFTVLYQGTPGTMTASAATGWKSESERPRAVCYSPRSRPGDRHRTRA